MKQTIYSEGYIAHIYSYGPSDFISVEQKLAEQQIYDRISTQIDLDTSVRTTADLHRYLIYLTPDTQDSAIYGAISGGIYSEAGVQRHDQWDFEENRPRALWIDYLAVRADQRQQGFGRLLISRMLELVASSLLHLVRKNVYVLAVKSALRFYRMNGFVPIYTKKHSLDERAPEEFYRETEQYHYARPLLEQLDQETELRD